MIGRNFAISLLIIAITNGNAPAQPDYSSAVHNLPARVQSAYERDNLPSISVAVVHDDTLIFSKTVGYADLNEQTRATSETIYRIASVTKLFTTTMMVRLAEEGILRLDDHVKDYVPEYEVSTPYPGTQPTTLRQLARHMSGLPRQRSYSFLRDHAMSLWILEGEELTLPPPQEKQEFLESIHGIDLVCPPYDTYGHYSNLGFSILGIALERAANQQYAKYVERNILKPLEMAHSGFDRQNLERFTIANGYIFPDDSRQPLEVPEQESGVAIYAGGMYSTAEDLCKFLSLQFQSDPPGGKQIISADGLRMLQWESMDWAFHWDAEFPALDHGGGIAGFSSHVIIIPGLKLGVTVLSNTLNPLDPYNPSQELAWEIVAELRQHAAVFKDPSRASAEPAHLAGYEGTYILGKNVSRAIVEMKNDSLYLHFDGHERHKTAIIRYAPNKFRYVDDIDRLFPITFEVSEAGKPTALILSNYRFIR